MPKAPSTIKTTFVIAILFGLGLMFMQAVAHQYPYYDSWDMDLITVIDGFLINSGHIPVHFAHPAAGMYALLHSSHWLAWKVGLIGGYNLNDLTHAVNPLAVVAEVTDFYRYHSAVVVALSALILWSALMRVFRFSIALSAVVFLILLSSPYGVAACVLVRTENYAFLYWSVAVLIAAVDATSRDRAGSRASWWRALLFGFMLGLALITKVQAIFLVALAFPLWLLFRTIASPADSDREDEVAPWLSRARWPLSLFLLFSLIAIFADARDVASFRSRFGMSGLWLVMLFGFLVIANERRLRLRFPAIGGKVIALGGARIIPVSLGFLASPLSGLLLGLPPKLGFKHILLSFKIPFMGVITSSIANQAGFGVERGLKNLAALGIPWLLVAAAAVTFILLARRTRAMRPAIVGWGVGVALILAANFVVVRDVTGRDMIWIEPALGLLLMIAGGVAWSRMDQRWPRIVVAAAAVFVLVFNFAHWAVMAPLTTGNFTEKSFFTDIYGGVQELYTDIMMREYVERLPSTHVDEFQTRATAAARVYDTDLASARNIFLNAQIQTMDIGRLSTSFRVWVDDEHARITQVDPGLEGAITLDVSGARHRAAQSITWSTLKQLLGRLVHEPYATEAVDSRGSVVMRARQDYQAYLVVEERESDAMAASLGMQPPNSVSVEITSGESVKRFKALRLSGAEARVNVDLLQGRYFFAMARMLRESVR